MLTTLLAAAVLALSPAKPDHSIAQSLGASSEQFTADLLNALKSEDTNTFFSPYSIQSAMWMAGTGAHGKTREEIRRTLHLGTDEAAARGFGSVAQILDAAGKAKKPDWAGADWQPPRLRAANRLWHSEGMKIHKSYTSSLEQAFGAEAQELDFQKASKSAAAINSWVSDITAKRITNLVSAQDIPGRGLVLTNAVYFKAGWSHKLHAVKSVDFTTAGGKAIKTRGMSEDHPFEYQLIKHAQVVRMYYAGDASMTIILPDAGKMKTVLEKLDISAIKPRQVGRVIDVTMPMFKTGRQASISDVLQNLGVKSAFDPATADFEGITLEKPTYISNVIHAANIDVDENGTEAAAATAITMTVGAPVGKPPEPIRFTVNRPFIFYISNTTSGTVLFAGIINDPMAK